MGWRIGDTDPADKYPLQGKKFILDMAVCDMQLRMRRHPVRHWVAHHVGWLVHIDIELVGRRSIFARSNEVTDTGPPIRLTQGTVAICPTRHAPQEMTKTPPNSGLVTGAALQASGDNIGSAIARELAVDFALLVADLRDPAETAAALGKPAVAFAADVTRPADCRAMVAAAEALGPLRVVVHAAGITRPALRVERIAAEEWELVPQTNLTSALHLCQAAIPALRRAGGGSIVLISSRAGRSPFASRGVTPVSTKAHYAASKAGIISLTRSLALELAADGIRVNCVAPGPVKGEMLPEHLLSAAAASVPLGRVADPREIARVVFFLCSEAASFVTGQTLDVNGGQVMH